MMVRSEGNGQEGYIAQVKETELLRRDNHRMVGELERKNAAIDHLRNQINVAEGTIREVAAVAAYHVRVAFVLGIGAGVVAVILVWGVVRFLVRVVT
jgi:hypothetical protein